MPVVSASKISIISVTSPSIQHARNLAKKILRAKLAACIQLIPSVESHYWWNHKIETSKEVLLLIKTDRKKLPFLEKFVVQNHPYEVPEILEVSAERGSKPYVQWLKKSLSSL